MSASWTLVLLAAVLAVERAFAAEAVGAAPAWSVGVIIAFFAGIGGLVTVIGGVLVKVIVALRDTRVALAEIKIAASDLDKKVDGVKADVQQVHEATNGLSHRLEKASGEAGFGRGQEKERKDERIRTAEAAVVAGAPPPESDDARADTLAQIEALLAKYRAAPAAPAAVETPDATPGPVRDTLRNAVAAIQEQTDKLTFPSPGVVAAEPPPKKTEPRT